MAIRALPAQDVLLQLLRYDPETGKLFWKERGPEQEPDDRVRKLWNTKHAHKPAFTASNEKGYMLGSIFGKMYYKHRVIWKLMTGDHPLDVDHIDGDRANNAFSNLRNVPHRINSRNMKKRGDNKSGKTGVSRCARGAWQASAKVDGRSINLGRFKHLEDAVRARELFETNNSYHENHGRR